MCGQIDDEDGFGQSGGKLRRGVGSGFAKDNDIEAIPARQALDE